eukprot:m51a1_g9632 hypothetical protein (495) ;mRNA; r:1143798-1145645
MDRAKEQIAADPAIAADRDRDRSHDRRNSPPRTRYSSAPVRPPRAVVVYIGPSMKSYAERVERSLWLDLNVDAQLEGMERWEVADHLMRCEQSGVRYAFVVGRQNEQRNTVALNLLRAGRDGQTEGFDDIPLSQALDLIAQQESAYAAPRFARVPVAAQPVVPRAGPYVVAAAPPPGPYVQVQALPVAVVPTAPAQAAVPAALQQQVVAQAVVPPPQPPQVQSEYYDPLFSFNIAAPHPEVFEQQQQQQQQQQSAAPYVPQPLGRQQLLQSAQGGAVGDTADGYVSGIQAQQQRAQFLGPVGSLPPQLLAQQQQQQQQQHHQQQPPQQQPQQPQPIQSQADLDDLLAKIRNAGITPEQLRALQQSLSKRQMSPTGAGPVQAPQQPQQQQQQMGQPQPQQQVMSAQQPRVVPVPRPQMPPQFQQQGGKGALLPQPQGQAVQYGMMAYGQAQGGVQGAYVPPASMMQSGPVGSTQPAQYGGQQYGGQGGSFYVPRQ